MGVPRLHFKAPKKVYQHLCGSHSSSNCAEKWTSSVVTSGKTHKDERVPSRAEGRPQKGKQLEWLELWICCWDPRVFFDQPDGHFEKHDAPALCHPCAIPGTGPNNIRMFLCFCKPTPFPSTWCSWTVKFWHIFQTSGDDKTKLSMQLCGTSSNPYLETWF